MPYHFRSKHEVATLAMNLLHILPEPMHPRLPAALDAACGCPVAEQIDPDSRDQVFPAYASALSRHELQQQTQPFLVKLTEALGPDFSENIALAVNVVPAYWSALAEAGQAPEIVRLRHISDEPLPYELSELMTRWERVVRGTHQSEPINGLMLSAITLTGSQNEVEFIDPLQAPVSDARWFDYLMRQGRRHLDHRDALGAYLATPYRLVPTAFGEPTDDFSDGRYQFVATVEEADGLYLAVNLGRQTIQMALPFVNAAYGDLTLKTEQLRFRSDRPRLDFFYPGWGLAPDELDEPIDRDLPKRIHFAGPGEYERLIKHLTRGVRAALPACSAAVIKNAVARGAGYSNYTALAREADPRGWPQLSELDATARTEMQLRLSGAILLLLDQRYGQLGEAVEDAVWDTLTAALGIDESEVLMRSEAVHEVVPAFKPDIRLH